MKPALVGPTLILDEAKSRANIVSMVQKATRHRLLFRPHFKTHQSHKVGRWFREVGVASCTVSSVAMAEYFARDGWEDITVAFPLNYHEGKTIDDLASRIRLNLLAVNAEALEQLAPHLNHSAGIFIELDTGYHRTGVDPDDEESIERILRVIERSTFYEFRGFLSHAGHSYKCRSKNEVEEIHRTEVHLHNEVKKRYRVRYPGLVSSIGDTPSMSCSDLFDGIDEIRPGNFVFYDLMQVATGACSRELIAVAMACPVVAIYPGRNEVVIHGGAVHFSKESIRGENGAITFGEARITNEVAGSPVCGFIKSLSQEHGIIQVEPGWLEKIKVGDFLLVLPVHSCLTADCMKSLVTTEGEVIDMMQYPRENQYPR